MARNPNCRRGRGGRRLVADDRDRQAGSNGAFLVVAAAWFAMMAGSNLATPLYAVYEREFGFSKRRADARLRHLRARARAVAAAVRSAVRPAGPAAGDGRGLRDGDRGLVLFALASGLAWLFAARAVQGLAVGMISGAAAAALVELDPAPQEDRAALFAALAQAGGSASGPLLAGHAGRVGAGAARAAVRGLHRARGRRDDRRARDPRARPDRPRPPARRPPERPAGDPRPVRPRERHRRRGLGASRRCSSSVVPSYAADLLDTSNLALLGADQRAGARAPPACAQIAAPRRRPPRPRAHAGRRAAPARRGPARARPGLPDPLAARPARRRPSSPAPATASPSSAPRPSSTSPPRPTAAARSTRPSTR